MKVLHVAGEKGGTSASAEYVIQDIFRLRSAAAFSSCHMKHFTDSRTRANIISQYTLR